MSRGPGGSFDLKAWLTTKMMSNHILYMICKGIVLRRTPPPALPRVWTALYYSAVLESVSLVVFFFFRRHRVYDSATMHGVFKQVAELADIDAVVVFVVDFLLFCACVCVCRVYAGLGRATKHFQSSTTEQYTVVLAQYSTVVVLRTDGRASFFRGSLKVASSITTPRYNKW